MTSYAVPSPLLSTPGAVVAEGPDAGVAAHYGDPMREQRLLTEGLSAVDLSHRGVVTITGPDRLSWLHSMTTQALTGLAPGIGTESLVLSPKVTSSTPCMSSTTARRRGSPSSPGHRRRSSPGWSGCASCSGWRSPTSPIGMPSSENPCRGCGRG